MRGRLWFGALIVAMAAIALAPAPEAAARPEGTLTVAVATFGNERWLPHLYVGAEDVVLKPMYENLLTRDQKGELAPMLAERWQVLDGGKTWRFHLRKGVQFHGGRGELTAEDVRFTFASIAKDGSANSLATEFRLIKSMEVEGPHTLTVRFEQPSVVLRQQGDPGALRLLRVHPVQAPRRERRARRRAAADGDRPVEVRRARARRPHRVRGGRGALAGHAPLEAPRVHQGARASHAHGHAAGGQRRRDRGRRRVRRRAQEGRGADDPHAQRLLGVHHPRRAVGDQAHLRSQGAVGAARRREGAQGPARPQPGRGQAGDHAAGAGRPRHRRGLVAGLPQRPVGLGRPEEAHPLRPRAGQGAARGGGVSQRLRRDHEPHGVAGPRVPPRRGRGGGDLLGEGGPPGEAPPGGPGRRSPRTSARGPTRAWPWPTPRRWWPPRAGRS